MRKLRQYEFVIEIARCGSISKAARYLNLAQPTLSKYLTNLEEEIGVELFDRTTIPVKLTEAGRRYLAAGEHILKTYQKLKGDLDEIKAGMADSVRVGMSPTRAHFILPELVKNFKAINSEAKIIVEEYTTSELNENLLKGKLDLTISLQDDETNRFDYIPLSTEETVLAVPEKYKDYGVERILKECPFISRVTDGYLSDLLLNILYEYRREEPTVEAQSIESILALVNDNVGVGLVPSYVKDRCHYGNVIYMKLPDKLAEQNKMKHKRQICIFYKDDKQLSKAGRDFIKAAKSTAGL